MAVAERAGAAEIIAVDMHEAPLEIAQAVGATGTILATDAEAIEAVQADVVLESSGNHRGLASALRGAMRGGKVVMVGLLPSGDQPVPISLATPGNLNSSALSASTTKSTMCWPPSRTARSLWTRWSPTNSRLQRHWRPSTLPRTPPGPAKCSSPSATTN